jgi:hypothetical protein
LTSWGLSFSPSSPLTDPQPSLLLSNFMLTLSFQCTHPPFSLWVRGICPCSGRGSGVVIWSGPSWGGSTVGASFGPLS